MSREYLIYCAGTFCASASALEVRNPYNRQLVATTWLADKTILEKAIAGGLSVQQELKDLPAFSRYEILQNIAQQISDSRARLAEVLARESAKPLRYALGEIDRAMQTFIVASEECKRLPKEYISLDWTSAGAGKEGIVKYFPIGLVAGIAPFNFPMNLAVHKIAPAIASGCPIILKPASSTPLSTLELARIIDSTALPKGAVSILPMDRKTGNQLVTDERIRMLSFTGSPVVGWEMKKNAGRKKVVLELGGNAAVIIAASADLNKALSKSIIAGFAYSGQICIHAQRFFVHESLFDKFCSSFVAAAKALKYGDPADEATEISSMIDEDNAIRVEKWIAEATAAGATVLLDGSRNGSYVGPTVLTNTTNKMKVCSEEIFGPVVTIEKYSRFDEAIRMVNDTSFGLQAGVFTNDLAETDLAFNSVDVGGVIINDVPTFRVDHMPYGGIKDSGLGREGVKYAIHDMMEARILVK